MMKSTGHFPKSGSAATLSPNTAQKNSTYFPTTFSTSVPMLPTPTPGTMMPRSRALSRPTQATQKNFNAQASWSHLRTLVKAGEKSTSTAKPLPCSSTSKSKATNGVLLTWRLQDWTTGLKPTTLGYVLKMVPSLRQAEKWKATSKSIWPVSNQPPTWWFAVASRFPAWPTILGVTASWKTRSVRRMEPKCVSSKLGLQAHHA
jgi:hypothetical protein